MNSRQNLSIVGVVLATHLLASAIRADELTLRSLGAVGDGKTDDRAAVEAALVKAAGAPVDGEGATYAIEGNIEVHNDVNLRNATFVQTMKPVDITSYIPSARGKGTLTVEPASALRKMMGPLPMLGAEGIATYSDDPVLTDEQTKELMRTIDLNTLSINGTKEKPIAVRLEKVKINRGKSPQTGDDNCAAVFMRHVSPIALRNVEVTGNGKGCGISMRECANVRLERVNIHDMTWAPLLGDNIFEVTPGKSIKEDFGWNNFPIYSFRGGEKRFVRLRIREQMAGILIVDTNDVQLLDCKVERLQAKLDGKMVPLQADGITLTGVTNFVMRNCEISKVWEGLDITGSMCDGILVENCTATDLLSYGFKLAHPKRNAKYVNCTSLRAGMVGFVMEPEMENIEFIHCRALETGANGYWRKENGDRISSTKGFSLDTNSALPTPSHVTFRECAVINKKSHFPVDVGFLCEGGINPVERQIRAVGCTVVGAEKEIQGIAVE